MVPDEHRKHDPATRDPRFWVGVTNALLTGVRIILDLIR
jgi:hypothetical protein